MTDYSAMTDEQLWNSPLGERLRHYTDKLLLAEAERIRITSRRQTDGIVAEGLEFGRAIVSPLGDPDAMLGGLADEPTRADTDPWAQWNSPERTGLTEALKATDGTREAAQQAAKQYIARLQDEKADIPAAGPEENKDVAMHVMNALSYFLTGRRGTYSGPFVVNDANGFHDEPYVMISVANMAKVLDRIPAEEWK